MSMTSFDAGKYWRERLAKFPGLQGTGTSFHPLAWQKWLYRGKERAYQRLLRKAGLNVAGIKVLDFGCGRGYFEDFWESLGASSADGIDIVPEVIDRLQRDHPGRKYLCADISQDSSAVSSFEAPDLITALDVLYHIIDDRQLIQVLAALTKILPEHGYFMFTDTLKDLSSAPHVHFRSFERWQEMLGAMEMHFVCRQAVFSINNREIPGINMFPSMLGASQHVLDSLFLRVSPNIVNNWALLFRKISGNDKRT